MIGVDLFVSCGAEVDSYRNTALDVFRRIEQMFDRELNVPLAIGNWDFRIDNPRVVQAGGLAARSLDMVQRTNAMIAIFGQGLPRITCQEIREAFRQRQAGASVEVWLFLDRQLRGRPHADFVSRIRREFHEQIVFGEYTSELDFQAMLFTTLIPYLLRRLRQAPVPMSEAS